MGKIPILVVAFNRADHVTETMKAIREYKPDKLYLECDGPRKEKHGERVAVEATRKSMLDVVDWPCEVKTLFREENLGCANAVSDAISWFFHNEEYGIICEDDVILGLDYFLLCEDLLPRYLYEERIMKIQSMNRSNRKDIPNSYVYSYFGGCSGWATWRRAWAKMDMSMSALPTLSWITIMKRFGIIPGLNLMRNYWYGYRHLDTFSSWAYRWSLSIQANNGLLIVPGVNLATNIGSDSGTHYGQYDTDPFKDLKIGTIEWPLVYNDTMVIDKKQRRYGIRGSYRSLFNSIKKKFRQILHIKAKP